MKKIYCVRTFPAQENDGMPGIEVREHVFGSDGEERVYDQTRDTVLMWKYDLHRNVIIEHDTRTPGAEPRLYTLGILVSETESDPYLQFWTDQSSLAWVASEAIRRGYIAGRAEEKRAWEFGLREGAVAWDG